MANLKNVRKATLTVRDADGNRVHIEPGATAKGVKGNFADNLFVKAGWLEVEGQAKQSSKQAAKQEQEKQDNAPAE